MFSILYSVTFGGFVGLATYLTIFYNTQFGLSPVKAADFTTICVIGGSFFRPVGGWLADKIGGIRMLMGLYGIIAIMMLGISTLPGITLTTIMLFIAMMSLGMGNGSVFQLVPQRFRQEIGIVTGIVGAAGGLGGYFLPKILGNMKLTTGSFAPGFLILGCIALSCIILLVFLQIQWRRTWIGEGGKVSSLQKEPA
jgi:NNP family nitrate/nitrite transporter-like MFS transporter